MPASRLKISLFFLRLGVFIVMLMWTLDKFIRPDHTEKVFQHFYHVSSLSPDLSRAVGGLQLLLVLAFGAGLFKRVTYGAILLLHAVSTLSAYHQYSAPYEATNLLFFAAWPMLSACIALYLLREQDTFMSLSSSAVR